MSPLRAFVLILFPTAVVLAIITWACATLPLTPDDRRLVVERDARAMIAARGCERNGTAAPCEASNTR